MTQETKIQAPPASKDSEMMVLGCMLTYTNSLNTGCDMLEDCDFYFAEHKIIFQILKNAWIQDRPVDTHLVCEELKRQEKLPSIGGIGYIITLAQYAGTSAFIEEYARIVKEKAILRAMINASQNIQKNALEEPADVHNALDEAQALFFQIGQSTNRESGKLISEILSGERSEYDKPYLKVIEERQENFILHGPDKGGITGIKTGFVDLDKMLNGFNNSNLMILAARPAMGKTALALNFAENIAIKTNQPVGIFSLEMSAEQLTHRLICSRAEVPSDRISTGSLSSIEYQKVVSAVGELNQHVMVIDDQPGLKITELRSRARRMKEAYGIAFLVIDYLQLLTGSGNGRGGENRQNEISEISRMLKNLARELNIPILCLSQLSRKVEERPGHRPVMSDLRESGSIEQDADIVMFLLRREYYDVNDKPGMAELIMGKNRHGAIGTVNLTYRKDFAQFANHISMDKKEESINESFSRFTPNWN